MNVVIVHGWSDKAESMRTSIGALLTKQNARRQQPIDALTLHYVDYNSLEDQANLEDIAEGLYTELKAHGLLDAGVPPLHFITHSTGALVVRQLLKQFAWANIAGHVDRVFYLAPANFGSPLASKGTSLLGRLAKGNRQFEDFNEVGVQILSALELASPKQWELAEYDLFAPSGTLYGDGRIRACVITGARPYGGIRKLINEDGTDGTIVVAGAGLQSRIFTLDLVRVKNHGEDVKAAWLTTPDLPNVPLAIHADCDHATILENDDVASFILTTLADDPNHTTLQDRAVQFTTQYQHLQQQPDFQQFYFRLRDDRNMPITDYHMLFDVWDRSKISNELVSGFACIDAAAQRSDEEERRSSILDDLLKKNAHTHGAAPEYRRFLLDVRAVNDLLTTNGAPTHVITMSIEASAGDKQIAYHTKPFERMVVFDPSAKDGIALFYPNTTTLVDVRVDRFSSLVAITA